MTMHSSLLAFCPASADPPFLFPSYADTITQESLENRHRCRNWGSDPIAGGAALCYCLSDVLDYAQKLTFLSPAPISEESLAIAALFHDVCKVNFYTTEYRNKKIDGVWQEVPFYTVDERYHFGAHGGKSVYQVQYFLKLTPEEAAAINCHMGFSDGNAGTVRDVSDAYGQFPLAWIIHVADEAAAYLLER